MRIYLIGSLRNERIPEIANRLRKHDVISEVFDDWYSAGPQADDHWKAYEQGRGHTHREALENWPAKHVFGFDRKHLERCDAGVLVMPAGKSGHLELGYMLGLRKLGFILFPDGELPDRWDVMHLFASAVCFSVDDLEAELARYS